MNNTKTQNLKDRKDKNFSDREKDILWLGLFFGFLAGIMLMTIILTLYQYFH